MDIETYISSGQIELYVLGLLSPSEMKEVEVMLMQYPALKEEQISIEDAIERVAKSASKLPPKDLKNKILLEIASSKESSIISLTDIPEASPKKSNQYWAIAASLALVISVAYTIYLKTNFENKLSSAVQSNITLNDSLVQSKLVLSETQLALNESKNAFSKIIDPATLKIDLGCTVTEGKNVANVYWNKNSKEVFIQLNVTDTLESGKQLQLWALCDGKPVDAGVMESNADLHKLTSIDCAQAFAITIENKGGSPTPTLSKMIAFGKI